MNIVDRLNASMGLLTEKQKSIVRCMLADTGGMCYKTLAEFSREAECTEVTVIRLVQKLGFDNFASLKNAFRAYMKEGFGERREQFAQSASESKFSHDSTDARAMVEYIANTESKSFNEVIADIDYDAIVKAAKEIIAKRSVFIYGRGPSKVAADFLRYRLSLLGIRTFSINPEDVDEVQNALNRVSDEDLSIFITFPMYYTPIINIAQYEAKRNVKMIAITDCATAPICSVCDIKILTAMPIDSALLFYSYASTFFTINLIVTAVRALSGSKHSQDVFDLPRSDTISKSELLNIIKPEFYHF